MSPTLNRNQVKQLASVRALFRGKMMLVEGGAWTVESLEAQKRTLALEQLSLARQLRLELEQIADQVGDGKQKPAAETKRWIRRAGPAMNRLASLSQAVQGRYFLQNYDEYNEWQEREKNRRKEQLDNSCSVLRDQVKRMAAPDEKWPPRTKVEEEKKVSPEPRRPPPAAARLVAPPPRVAVMPPKPQEPEPWNQPEGGDDNESIPAWAKGADELPDPEIEPDVPAWAKGFEELPDPDSPANSGQQMSDEPLTSTEEQKRPTLAVDGIDIRSHVLKMQAQLEQKKDKKKKKRKRKEDKHRDPQQEIVAPDEASSSDFLRRPAAARAEGDTSSKRTRLSHQDTSPSTTGTAEPPNLMHELLMEGSSPSSHPRPYHAVSSSQAAARRTSFQRSRLRAGPKKCHICKTYQQDYLKCRFLHNTGSRCGKHFCMDCVNSQYSEDYDPASKEDWHCPSCLDKCKCSQCTRQREREKRRSKILHGRPKRTNERPKRL